MTSLCNPLVLVEGTYFKKQDRYLIFGRRRRQRGGRCHGGGHRLLVMRSGGGEQGADREGGPAASNGGSHHPLGAHHVGPVRRVHDGLKVRLRAPG
jgi:hypothetical protein